MKVKKDEFQIEVETRKKLLARTKQYSIYYSKGNIIVINNYLKRQVMQIKNESAFQYYVSKFRILERLLRLEPRCSVKLSETSFLISWNGKVYFLDVALRKWCLEHYYIKGMKNPLSFCVVTLANNKRVVYYGEYTWNVNREMVGIWKREEGFWSKVYSFSAGTITHIHNIIYDQIHEEFIILTGDSDSESGIWKADALFEKVSPVLKGKQIYRTCFAVPTKQGIYYATDTPLEPNGIYCANYNPETNEWYSNKLYEIPGPCIYAKEYNGFIYFATSVEPDSSLNSYRYRLTYKLGKGVKDRYCYIYRYCYATNRLDVIIRSKKDVFPMWLFQFGNFMFPDTIDDDIVVTAQSLKKIDGCTVRIKC